MASAADDQTVAVWSLTDLDKVVNKGGAVAGFAVELKAGKLVASTLDGDALSAGNRAGVEGRESRRRY